MPRGFTSAEKPADSLTFGMERPTPIKDAAVHRLAKSITQLTLCQVTTSEVDDATKLLENIPSQRVNDLDAAIRQLRQIGCILDSCTISASYEVTQAQKAILQLFFPVQRRYGFCQVVQHVSNHVACEINQLIHAGAKL